MHITILVLIILHYYNNGKPINKKENNLFNSNAALNFYVVIQLYVNVSKISLQ